MKLALGTVQFGLDYGVVVPNRRVSLSQVTDILQLAHQQGISVLDTAYAYGRSEEVLGTLSEVARPFDIVTKLPHLDNTKTMAIISDFLHTSLRRLKRQRVFAVLFHQAQDLFSPQGKDYFDALVELKSAGYLQKLGVSTYTPEDIDRIVERFAIDLIQVPMNILDQRLLSGGQLLKLHRLGIEIHVRSAYLQGLLLTDPTALPPFFDPIKAHLKRLRRAMNERGLTPLEACLGFLDELKAVTHIVIGVVNRHQLQAALDAYQRVRNLAKNTFDWTDYGLTDSKFIDPRCWNV